MQKVHLLDYLGYAVYRPKVPLPLTRTIVWGSNVYIAGRPKGDGTPRYYLTTVYVCPDTHPSGIWTRSELGLEDKPDEAVEDEDEDEDDAPKAVKFPGSDTFKRSEILLEDEPDELPPAA